MVKREAFQWMIVEELVLTQKEIKVTSASPVWEEVHSKHPVLEWINALWSIRPRAQHSITGMNK